MKKLIFAVFLCMLGMSSVFAQKTFSGKVTDATGLGLPGVNVVEKINPSNGFATDIEGNWTLTVPNENSILVFRAIGMKNIEIKAKDAKNIEMKEDAEMLGEVVVTGMQKTDKRLFTGAADKIEADDVKLGGISDVSRAIEGHSAGVVVQNVSGTFGAAPKIRVRGATSIYGSSKPLWVVDGVVVEDVVEVSADDLASGDAVTLISSAIAGLNSEDIESFQVLKDGSATSIYGAKAMAGVIVITTKKGRKGSQSFNYSGELTYRFTPSYSNFDIMNSQEQMSLYQDMQNAGWLNYADLLHASESGVYGKMYQNLYEVDPKTGEFLLKNTIDDKIRYLRQAEMRNTDWFSELFNQNIIQSHSMSVSAGTEKSSYYASLSVMTDPGWTKSSDVKRYTGNFNANYNLLENLKINLIANGSYRQQKAPGTLGQSTDVVSGEVKRDFDINPYSYALNTSRALDPSVYYTRNYAPFNIFHELDNNYIDMDVTSLKFQGELKWKILEGLEASALGAVKYNAADQEHHITEFSNQAQAYRVDNPTSVRDRNPYLYTDPDVDYALPEVVLPQGGIFKKESRSILGYDFRTTLSYNTNIDNKHIVNLFGGMELNSSDRHFTWNRGWGMQYSMGEIPFYDYKIFKKGQEKGSPYYGLGNTSSRHAAFFANATYSYKGKYTVNGTVRYEGSNKLGKTTKSRWLPTWNTALSWNIYEEDFFKNLRNTISSLKLKTSYSLTATSGPYWVTNSQVVIKSFTPWRHLSSIQETALYIDALENADLTYEKKNEFNIGIDLGFLQNRINITADWYQRNNYDLIAQTSVQGLGGSTKKYGNIAEMESNGLELSVSTQNIKTKDFSWTTSFVYSHISNEVTKLENNARVIDMITSGGFTLPGYPVRSLFSIPFKGLDEKGIPTFTGHDGEITSTDIYFQDRERIDFLEYSGSVDPTDLGSLGNMFTYKNFRLNVFLTYSFGNVVRLPAVFRSSYSDLYAMPNTFKNRWTVPGDEAETTVPALLTRRQLNDNIKLSYAYNSYNYSSDRIAKGDFVRLKEISLSYDLPKKWLEHIKIRNLSLKLQATNIFLLYADKKLNGQDPEFYNAGGVAVPMPKQLTFTLKLGL